MEISVLSAPIACASRKLFGVENIRDVIAIESTQQYNGTYHVLGCYFSTDGIGPITQY
jgi:recombinational DNA repair protein RecR